MKHVVATSKTKDPFWGVCIRHLWLLNAYYDISLQVQHIRGKDNVKADLLSRLYSDKPVNQRILYDLKVNYIWDSIEPSYFDLNLSI